MSDMLTFMLIKLLIRNRKFVCVCVCVCVCVLLYVYKQNYSYLKTVHFSADMY